MRLHELLNTLEASYWIQRKIDAWQKVGQFAYLLHVGNETKCEPMLCTSRLKNNYEPIAVMSRWSQAPIVTNMQSCGITPFSPSLEDLRADDWDVFWETDVFYKLPVGSRFLYGNAPARHAIKIATDFSPHIMEYPEFKDLTAVNAVVTADQQVNTLLIDERDHAAQAGSTEKKPYTGTLIWLQPSTPVTFLYAYV